MIDPVVDLDRLRALGDDVVLADVRWYLDGRSGREAYRKGHLPGAVFIDLDTALAAPASPAEGRHPLPDPEVFAAAMSAAGVGDASTVVAYDDAGGVIAARLVWLLRALGREAALLDGGLLAYDGELTTDVPAPPEAVFTPVPWPRERLAGLAETVDGGHLVLDARDAARFRGDTEPVDPRPGHIPGARNLPCRDNVAADGRFLPVAQLRERFAAVGVDGSADVISYCGSGVTACHNLIAVEHAGLGAGRLYPGSWSQYSHTDRPAATGD
ncbi:thiosulfate/3-mercaptopyruvate sulfurtransferase [Actinoplanes octamycinicus]|uniref:Thiosulfate/3-mercaptopyruvate sulfurtransferase n=1 Tax=Actinoplanes octamycinicus TaxID=135948 RepID=A0A7W7M6J6_9ACTN|nr:sulfurtransferase [Actinoplanes octamycinicus]MBB4738810.1 thiosulfate/3-mercaptopyruvate sulfurtransferase [Actinoplanes octamycinicus]GIE63251.1 sulfurtransferase [Actinoplanes octamycinicus]